MGMFAGLWLVGLMTIVPGKALLDLNGTWEVEGTWRASVTLPCAYEPLPDFKEISVVWKTAQQDQGPRTIFHRDATSGDQTLLASFRGRLSVPKEPPGVVSLQIKALEMADVGRYICEVAWETRDKNRITRDRTTTLRVIKETVAPTEAVTSEMQVPRKASLPLFLVILIALLCAVLVFTAFAVIFFRRRAKDDRSYQVAYHNNSMNAREEGSPDCSGQVTGPCESPYEEPCARAQNNYTEEPARGGGYVSDETGRPGGTDYESPVNKVESEYELLEYK
ncbi:hypothetical protein lerEdw1_010337 [Lerista edwardsae]|nr:hypothetical protein lerEdw1_010337 [Lerista edwardsae]